MSLSISQMNKYSEIYVAKNLDQPLILIVASYSLINKYILKNQIKENNICFYI